MATAVRLVNELGLRLRAGAVSIGTITWHLLHNWAHNVAVAAQCRGFRKGRCFMAESRTKLAYPWGTKDVRTRIRLTSSRLRRDLEAARIQGFKRFLTRVRAASVSAHDLAVCMEYVGREGLRTYGKDRLERVPGEMDGRIAVDAVEEMYKSIGKVANSTIFSVSGFYEEFVSAAENALGAADQALLKGVVGCDDVGRQGIWREFEDLEE